MRNCRFTDEQMAAILRDADKTSVAGTAKKQKISEQTIYEPLTQLITNHGAVRYLRSDNSREFISRAICERLAAEGIEAALMDLGNPWRTGADESFNGKLRDECVSLEWFRSRAEASGVIENRRRYFNAVRPESSLPYLTSHAN